MSQPQHKWDIDVLLDSDLGRVLYIHSSDRMTTKEIEEAVEHMSIHGVWYKSYLFPSHRIHKFSVCKTDEEENVYQE